MKKVDLDKIIYLRDVLPHLVGTTKLEVILNNKFFIGPECGVYKNYIERGGEYVPFLMRALDDIVYNIEVTGNPRGFKLIKAYIIDYSLEFDILEYENRIYDEMTKKNEMKRKEKKLWI